MQDEFDAIVRRRQPIASAPQDDDEFGAIVNRRRQPVAPQARPPLWERIKATGRAIADDPLEAAKSIGKGLATNVVDLAHLSQGDFGYVAREMADEFAKGEGAKGRIAARGVGAASLVVPAARVGGAATSALVNTAANAGLGAAQTPDDPMLGAVLGGAIPLAGKTVGKVTGGVARKALEKVKDARVASAGEKVIADALGGLQSEVGPVARRKGPQSVQAIIDAKVDAGEIVPSFSGDKKLGLVRRPAGDAAAREAAKQQALDLLLIQDEVARVAATERISQGLDDSMVRPRANPLASADKPITETFLAELDGPRREVMQGTNARGEKTTVIDPEVKADRVTSEKLDVAEQRAAESQMVKEVKEIDKNVEQAQVRVERATQAAEKAAAREADALEREQAKALGLTKQYNARKAAEKLAALTADKEAKAEAAALAAKELETAAGMLGRANKGFAEGQRFKNAARSALARRRGVPVGDTPVPETLGGDLSPLNPPAIPEVPPAPVVASPGILEPPITPVAPEAPAITAPSSLPAADTPFLNWRTLGVDPAKPDALSMSAAARIQAAATRPDMVERLTQERGRTTFAAMNAEAQKSWAIQQLGIDPLAVDSKKLVGLSGAQIHALKAPLLENAGLMESIAREMNDLEGDDLVKATQTFERLEKSNDELLATIQREGSARGRDLGALRQMANMTTDPAVWLVKAKKALGDTPMTASVQARIMKLAKEASEACGGA